MKNRTESLIVGGVVILALIGISGMFLKNPSGFLQGIAVIVVIGVAIYFIVQLINKSNPQKKEQRAFLKAARKSKRRIQKKGADYNIKGSSSGTLAKLKNAAKRKKKTTAHLTVIDGKKGKKNKRASF